MCVAYGYIYDIMHIFAAPHRYKLFYFNAQGRGELSRMLFNAAGQPFVDHRINFSDWKDIKYRTASI